MSQEADPFMTTEDLAEPAGLGPVVTARDDGACHLPECTADIFAGDDIRYVEDLGGFTHADCAEGVA